MVNFPFPRFPYNSYYYRPHNPYYKANSYNEFAYNSSSTSKKEEPSEQDRNSKGSSEYHSFGPISFKNPFTSDIDPEEPIIEILGIKLYLDDIIILGILFILYKEEVKDEMLFISLILLLLS